MTRFNFIGPLNGEMFRGLTNLTSLDLSFSYFESINLDAFEYLKNLRNLTMTSCVGFDVFPTQSLRGPNKLEIVDLSSTKFVPQDTAQSQDSKPENDSPLSNIKMLNLSDSLINLDDAMEILGLSLMYNLSEVLHYFSLSILNRISKGVSVYKPHDVFVAIHKNLNNTIQYFKF